MKLPRIKKHGVVVILDALGVSLYDDTQIKFFFDTRKLLLDLFKQKQQELLEQGRINHNQIGCFTFNDTILVTYRTQNKSLINSEIQVLFLLLRYFFIRSIHEGILFRGAISIGDFFEQGSTNTILGPAVTDAAAWYDKAEWAGILLTPKATMDLKFRQELEPAFLSLTCMEYDIPLKGGNKMKLAALNWHSLLAVGGLKKLREGKPAKAWLLERLLKHKIPFGTEGKYQNVMDFFDYCLDAQEKAIQMKNVNG